MVKKEVKEFFKRKFCDNGGQRPKLDGVNFN